MRGYAKFTNDERSVFINPFAVFAVHTEELGGERATVIKSWGVQRIVVSEPPEKVLELLWHAKGDPEKHPTLTLEDVPQ